MGRFLVALSAVSFYVEISLTIFMLCLLSGSTWKLVLALLVSSVFLTNSISAVRVSQIMDFYRQPCTLLVCIVLHFFQLGFLWRYVKLVVTFNHQHWRDLMKIRLFHNCMLSVPMLLLVSLRYTLGDESESVHLASICASFLSIALTLSYFSDFQCKERTDYGLWICCMFWKLFSLFARFSAILWALTSSNSLWAAFLLGIHFVMFMIWYQLRDQSQKQGCSSFRLWLILLAVANTIDLTIAEYQASLQALICFYALALAENVALVGIMYSSPERVPLDLPHSLWMVSVFASFAIGLLISLSTMTIGAREKKTALQMWLNRWCRCSNQSGDESPFLWDAYDTKRNPEGHNNEAFAIEDKQKHVEIMNNALGVTDVVSLTTVATSPTSPANEYVIESPSHVDHLKRPNVDDKQLPVKPLTLPTTRRVRATHTERCNHTPSPPFFISPTGLRAHPMSCRKSDPSLPSARLTDTSHSHKSPVSIKPRRRLLFLTPTRLMSADRPRTAAITYGSTRSRSLDDSRPRWVDLNELYDNHSFSSLRDANELMPKYENETAMDRVSQGNEKVKSWLGESQPDCIHSSSKLKTLKQYETPL